jgi:hypothetical protein
MASTLPPYNFHPQFFTRDCPNLDPYVVDELCAFLERLQQNPFSPTFQGMERKGSRYAFEFTPGFVVYWKLQMSSSGQVEIINVSKLARVVDLL